MRWRRSWFSLKGTAGVRESGKGPPCSRSGPGHRLARSVQQSAVPLAGMVPLDAVGLVLADVEPALREFEPATPLERCTCLSGRREDLRVTGCRCKGAPLPAARSTPRPCRLCIHERLLLQ